MKWGRLPSRAVVMVLATAIVSGAAGPAFAQDSDARLRKIESEVRALQRKVFPGGEGRFFASEAQASGQASTLPPATSAVTDILARMDAIEGQIARLTSQVETNTNALALLNGRVAALEPSSVGTLPAETMPKAAPAATSTADANLSAMTGGASSAKRQVVSDPPAKPAAPSAERVAAVQAVAKPATGDAGEDEYVYGFRLWEAKFYPEAQQQLGAFVRQYPGHWRISYGRNLLGRAYLDNGQPEEAAKWFLENYKADEMGARAGDSLLFLAEAMIATKDTKRACIALAAFGETYAALASGRLQDQYEANRRKVTCN